VAEQWRNPQVIRAILGGRRPVGLAEIGLRDLAVGVFLFPGQVLVATRAFGNWRRPVLLLLLAGIACGLLTGVVAYPRIYRDSVAWAEWFGTVVGEFRVEASGFHWARPEQVPFTTRCKRWRVDFAADSQALEPQTAEGHERRGVWITPSRICLWWLAPAGLFSKSGSGVVVRTAELSDSVRALAGMVGRERFAERDFGVVARQIMRLAVPLYLAATCLSVMVPVVLYISLFTLMAVVLRRGEVTGGFAAVFAVNVLCAVPAVCVAGVYAMLGLAVLDFNTVFILAFFLYITMAFASVRRMLSEE
jgi:hypothetical protein